MGSLPKRPTAPYGPGPGCCPTVPTSSGHKTLPGPAGRGGPGGTIPTPAWLTRCGVRSCHPPTARGLDGRCRGQPTRSLVRHRQPLLRVGTMGVGRKLGYAAAIAGGLLLATAWAVAAQNLCNDSFGIPGLTFPTGCDDPDPALTIAPEDACNNLYTQGYWSNPALVGGAGEHEQHEANLIRTGLSDDDWSTGVVGGINWEFDAATETIETLWGYEDPATIAQTIADWTTFIANVEGDLACFWGR